MCTFHYNRVRNGRDPNAPKTMKRKDANGTPLGCSFEGCGRVRHSYGLCWVHRKALKSGSPLVQLDQWLKCSVRDCEGVFNNDTSKSRLCHRHAGQAWRFSLETDHIVDLLGTSKCGNPGCENTGSLHIDHDHQCCPRGKFKRGKHSCGKCVRGVLCSNCNTALGLLKEDARRMYGLVEYLKNYAVIS